MASRDKSDLHPTLVQAYDMACLEYKRLYPNDPQPFITCTYRSIEEQNALYQQGVTNPSKKVTNARGGESPHNFNPSFAFDIGMITVSKQLSWDQKYFRKFADCLAKVSSVVDSGINWRFCDPPHHELHNWKTLIKK